jgi:hypothetical protein
MSTRTDFEIRPVEGGCAVFADTRWWSDARNVRRAGGLARSLPFPSVSAAKQWVEEQFSVVAGSWTEQADGTHLASIGAPMPEMTREKALTDKDYEHLADLAEEGFDLSLARSVRDIGT